jgi:hypothetical protein
MHNPDFKGSEFETFRFQAGLDGMPQGERLKRLNEIALRQMKALAQTVIKVLRSGE